MEVISQKSTAKGQVNKWSSIPLLRMYQTSIDFLTGCTCHEFQRCEESKRTLNNSFASRAEVDTALFWIPQAKYVRIPDGPPGSTKNFPIPESGFPNMWREKGSASPGGRTPV